jgi:hypothetical protein
MALIWYEHFDLYGTTLANMTLRGYLYGGSQSVSLSSTSPRNGSVCMVTSATNGSSWMTRSVPSSAVLGSGVALRVENGPNTADGQHGIHFDVGGGVRVRAVINALFGINLYVGTTLVGSSDPNLWASGAYFWLELKASSGTGTGSLEARVNGVPAVSATGLTFGNMTGVSIGKIVQFGTIARHDDWVIWDDTGTTNNDFMGDTFVLVAPPTADGTPSDWTPNSGTDRFSRVNTTTPNDTTFISAAAAGQAQEFTHQSLNLPVGAVAAIASQTRAFKPDAGSADYRLGIASGASTSMSDDIALATGSVVHSRIENLDPDTGLPWTQAAAQSARLRVQRV